MRFAHGDAEGGLWAGVGDLGLIHVGEDGAFHRLTTRDGLPSNRVQFAFHDREGNTWTGYERGGLVRVRPRLFKVIGNTDALNENLINTVCEDSAGAVWIGTSGGGLTHLDLKSGAMHTLMRRDGLHDDVVFQVLDGGVGGDLWMTSNRGLYRVGRDRVLAAMRGGNSDLSGTVYGSTDGMPSAECTGASPAAIRARDGRIWVATARGVAVVDFNATARNPVPPVVHIDGVLVDGSAAPDGPLHVRAGAQRLEVHYTAVSLRAPERVTFRYRLGGFDAEWVDAGTSRVAHYTRLPAGDYTFHVTASNEDGVPSVAEGQLTFTVEPAWFETWWARLLGIAVLAAAIWGAIRIRVAAARAHLAEALEDANRQLGVANERLRALSYLDGLTGVANRRRFDEALEEACGNARRAGTPLSLALIDLDHFKELNDTSGHMNGDDALRTVAGILAKRAESAGGLVARFGGEEFAWLLPGIPPEVAKQEAELFRLSVRNAGIRHAGVTAGFLSASVGVAGSSGTALQPSTLVAAADAALYRAKSAGRDRVEVH